MIRVRQCCLSIVLLQLFVGCGGRKGGAKATGENEFERVTINGKDMVIVPASFSDARVEKLGLSRKGSEDAAHLLVPPALATRRQPDGEVDCRPVEAIEWVVDFEFAGSPVLAQPQIIAAFDDAWFAANGQPIGYGWSPEINHWTFLVSADAPKTFTKLAFGWPLYKAIDPKYVITSVAMNGYLAATTDQAKRLGKPTIRVNRSPQDAEALSGRIRAAVAECDREAVIVLKSAAGNPFAGNTVWDVMMSLGLRWGDGDLFHWQNESAGGGDELFSVWTSTPPGYFLPERIADGSLRVGDLVFGFSIPRSPDPLGCLDSMSKAAEYARKRLGGQLQQEDGSPWNESTMKRETREIVRKLQAAGFIPGESATLRVF